MIVLLVAAGGHAWGFNPPSDTAGPLTVEIKGPEVVVATDKPLPVHVVMTNKGQRPLVGKLRLAVVDRWRIEPKETIEFSVPAGGEYQKIFIVEAGRGTYSGHYPIHAYADFTHDGKPLTAHPILVLETKLPSVAPAVAACEWKPFIMGERKELGLWLLPMRRVVVAVDGKAPLVMPMGWQGSEPTSQASLHIRPETLEGDSRDAIFMHPPWADGQVGRVLCEFPIEFPKADNAQSGIRLRFACGLCTGTEESDGVTFRVRVAPLVAEAGAAGEVIFERHVKAGAWNDFEADLSRFAGRAVRLQLESDPGPKRNTGWDHSLWAEPMLLVGEPQRPQEFPPVDKDKNNLISFGKVQSDGGRYEVRLQPGQRGLLDTLVSFSDGQKQLAFRGFETLVQGERLGHAASPTTLVGVEIERGENRYEARHKFQNYLGETFTLTGRLAIENGVLQASFRLQDAPPDRPWRVFYLEDVAAGPWNRKAQRIYAGTGSVICNPESFDLGLEGHRLATSFVGFEFEDGLSIVQAVDVPCRGLTVRPDDRHYSLHVPHESTISFIPTDNVWKGVKKWREINGLTASAGVRKLAGRFVFDLWGGRYKANSKALERSFRYGLTDAAVVWHDWQRWGYDYRLPNICPPNPEMGTLDEMRDLSETCRRAGVLFAPHDNYIDFYPDADGFSYEKHIAFRPDGRPVRAWINEGRKAQSYRYRPESIAEFLQPNVKWIKDKLAPTAYFIDVWSSIAPYDYWTSDGRFGTGIFTRDTWAAHFTWIREQLGDDAPQISEAGHDQLIGFLDGAQTNHLRVGKPIPGRHSWSVWNIDCDDAERIPWFDAAHHDRFVGHGAGYPSRYEGGLDPRTHGIYSDDYVATEVLTGHPGMVNQAFSRDVVRKYWLLADLMRALALRTIERVEFVDGDIHRLYVRWSGGGQVWVNRGKSDWTVGGRVLPEFGFYATIPGERGKVEASIERREGVIVESARLANCVYVNGRQVANGLKPIRPLARRFESIGGREFSIDIDWLADEPVPNGWVPFLHFVDAEGKIVFQTGHNPPKFDGKSTGVLRAATRGSAPNDLGPGTELELRVGLYKSADGKRLWIDGLADDETRIRLGKIRLQGQGEQVARIAWTPQENVPQEILTRLNTKGKTIDFGDIRTEGGCRLFRDKDALRLIPLPEGRKFTVRIGPKSAFASAGAWKFVETLDEDEKVVGRSAVKREGDSIVVECEPGVFGYRLVVSPG